MSGNMHRWSSNDLLLPRDDVSQYSATYSDVSAVDDRIRFPDIGQRLHSLFKEQLYTDVKFVVSCGIRPKPILLAHKAILAIGSEKFREILFDSSQSADSNEIQINNIPFNAFRNVVEFLYTDDVMFDKDQSVIDTLSAAQQFKIQSLIDKCESYIDCVELTEENVCAKFHLANAHKLASLKRRCTEFIQENTGPVLRSADFLAANLTTVRSICKMEKINLRSEIELLASIIRWVEANPVTNMPKRALVEPFFKHIRLLAVSCEDFNQFVQKHHDIFTAPEAANIVISLANPANPAPNLPSWCKRGSNRCALASKVRERGGRGGAIYNIDRRLFIHLKSSNCKEYLSNITSILEMRCLRGNHRLIGLKLSFDDPVDKMSVIDHLHIRVRSSTTIVQSKYYLEEHIKIENSKDVEVIFSKRIYANAGNTITISAEAKDVNNYRFLQFDEGRSFSRDSPFICTLGSVPKQNRLFFISEIIYENAPPPSRRSEYNQNFRGNPRRREPQNLAAYHSQNF